MQTAAPQQTEPAQTTPQEGIVMPPLRNDLIVTRQIFESRTYYVVKDPVSLQYFRMSAEDYFLATLFDGKRTFGQIRENYVGRFPQIRLDLTDEEISLRVSQFANDLALMQFLAVQGHRLKDRYTAIRKRKAGGHFTKLISQIFFSRFSIFDPDELFGKMAKPLWWIWTRATLWISLAIIGVAVVVFIQSYGRIAPTMSNFFTLQNLGLIWVATILIKSIHELGHGLTCKHFGSEVHEVGLMVLVFTPYFFVNVSDSWVMPKRNHRILVSAAGIYVELILASFATFLWAVVQPGMLQQVLFNVMVIASVSTVVFNANPLMRFDGYYIATDLLEIPNLQPKSRAFIGYKVKQLLFGRNAPDPVLSRMPLPKRRFWLFYFYAIASYFYGYFVIYKITMYMSLKLAPYGLETVGTYLSGAALFMWVVAPLFTFGKSLKLTRDDWKSGGRLRRLTRIGGAALLLFAVFCVLPHRLTITRSLAVQLADPDTVRPEISGTLEECYVNENDHVKAGAPLAKLRNRDIEARHAEATTKVRITEAVAQRAMGMDNPAEYREAMNMKSQAETALKQAKADLDHLTLRSRGDGIVLTRDLQSRIGSWVRLGENFCQISPVGSTSIAIPLGEKQVRYVKQGQRVELKSNAYPDRLFTGHIAEQPLLVMGRDLPPALSEKREGDVVTGVDREGHEVPLERIFQAKIQVDDPDGLLRQGMTGRAKIYTGRHLYGKLLLQSLLDLISLDYRF